MLKPRLRRDADIFIEHFFRPSPKRFTHLDADQLYPASDYAYNGGGYFNPLEAVTSSPMRTHSPFRTLPRPPGYEGGVAINPLRDYGYPSDFGLPMASMASSNLTFNPLSELDEDEYLGQMSNHQRAGPMVVMAPPMNKMNLSTNSSTGSSTLSPPRGQLSSSGIGDLSTTSGTKLVFFF